MKRQSVTSVSGTALMNRTAARGRSGATTASPSSSQPASTRALTPSAAKRVNLIYELPPVVEALAGESRSVSECGSGAFRIGGIVVFARAILALEATEKAARRDEVDHDGGDSRGKRPRSPLVQLPTLHAIDEFSIEADRLTTPRTR